MKNDFKFLDQPEFTTRFQHLREKVKAQLVEGNPKKSWQNSAKNILSNEKNFDLHEALFKGIYHNWNEQKEGPPPAWSPTEEEKNSTHIKKVMAEKKILQFEDFYYWSIIDRESFWKTTIDHLGITFLKKPDQILNIEKGVEDPIWLKGAQFNIAQSCFNAPKEKVAIRFQKENTTEVQEMTYGQLDQLSSQVANGLNALGLKAGDAIAIDMLMNVESVAIYLGIVKAGMQAVSIADSFAPHEIKARLEISKAKAVFTQDYILRGDKKLPLYQKVVEANASRIILLGATDKNEIPVRAQDVRWEKFLSENTTYAPIAGDPDNTINILFSSGTTGDPKAIPWTGLTPIKAASDGFYHQDIQKNDVVCWPTNLGWMMGPWLIFASLINQATMALYYGPPMTKGFGKFIENAKVTILGLVPSIVKQWRVSNCMEDCDFSSIKLFSSTGECSNASDYLYLMSLANYRPIIEYCGGTEIGGGYLTGTLLQDASPSTFSTPALGIEMLVLDDEGKEAASGEVFLVPPSIGLSQRLLNFDHQKIYYLGAPRFGEKKLRKHGDQLECLGKNYFKAQGRADDTMNLGGIKVSSAEIERVLKDVDGVLETAAIAVCPEGGGPSLLVVFVVLMDKSLSLLRDEVFVKMQSKIKKDLNPLFKIYDLVFVEQLPRTASNKVMRRELRAKYQTKT